MFIAIIPVQACVTIYLRGTSHCKHDRFTTSLLKFQHASLHATAYHERRSACDCVTLGEQRLHEIPPQQPFQVVRSRLNDVTITSVCQHCGFQGTVVYFVQFEWKIRRCTGLNVLFVIFVKSYVQA